MAKKLPKIYAGPINKNITNNKTVFYEAYEEKEVKTKQDSTLKQKSTTINQNGVNKKLDNILHGNRYVYNIDVDIVTFSKTISTRIAGKRGNVIITLDNDVIPISEIKDIVIKN